ncbi:PGG domain-containing protein [Artemisia annua]|uniref:PGG domain-containing protein n=1 Tax=Artemisia annua TaxID=35608 RepID=A0A2U1KVJ6_ARTAN|nr:PGG domain-containing protein [Artemisia annua]
MEQEMVQQASVQLPTIIEQSPEDHPQQDHVIVELPPLARSRPNLPCSDLLHEVADAISLFSSAASILMFLSILTSRYAERDFLKSLPKKLTLGSSVVIKTLINASITCKTVCVRLQSLGKALRLFRRRSLLRRLWSTNSQRPLNLASRPL